MIERIVLAVAIYALLWTAIILAALWNVYVTAAVVAVAVAWLAVEIHRAPLIKDDYEK